MSEEETYCAKCQGKTDQILTLACDHNLCISCAAENLSRQETSGVSKSQNVVCDLCQTRTEIDTETTKQILSIALNKLNQANFSISQNSKKSENYICDPKSFVDFEQDNVNFNYNNFPNVQNQKDVYSNANNSVNLVYFKEPNPNSNAINISELHTNNQNNARVCQEHGEPITYLCLDCLSKCICSECVVHGIHKTHEVLNIKKAYPIIYGKTQELVNFLMNNVGDLNKYGQQLEKKKGEIAALNNKCRNEIRGAFEQIRSKLNEKEKEILTKTEDTLKDNISELNTYSRVIQSKVLSLNKTIDSINAHLFRKDELTLINFYCDNKSKILQQTKVREMENMPELTNFSNTRIDIDKGSFDAMLQALNCLRFEINTVKGVNINSKIDTKSFSTNRNLYGTSSQNVLVDDNFSKENTLKLNNQNYFSTGRSNFTVPLSQYEDNNNISEQSDVNGKTDVYQFKNLNGFS